MAGHRLLLNSRGHDLDSLTSCYHEYDNDLAATHCRLLQPIHMKQAM